MTAIVSAMKHELLYFISLLLVEHAFPVQDSNRGWEICRERRVQRSGHDVKDKSRSRCISKQKSWRLRQLVGEKFIFFRIENTNEMVPKREKEVKEISRLMLPNVLSFNKFIQHYWCQCHANPVSCSDNFNVDGGGKSLVKKSRGKERTRDTATSQVILQRRTNITIRILSVFQPIREHAVAMATNDNWG